MPEELPPLEEFTETIAETDSEQSTSPPPAEEVVEPTPEAEPATAAETSSPTSKLNIADLGYYLDGWADLVEGKADQAEKVYQSTVDILNQRFPVAPPAESSFNISKVAHDKTRAYISTSNRPGATTTIYVGARGDDLYVSWRTYIKPVPKTLLLIIIVVVGLFIGYNLADGNISSATFVIVASIVILLELALLAAAGRLQKGNSAAYFYEEPSVFDAEDITAMSMAAHKSIHRALDKEGIDVKQLRLKQNFVGGRRDEPI